MGVKDLNAIEDALDTLFDKETRQFNIENATYSPQEVRNLLGIDSKQIENLCKQVCIFPKKDNLTGEIFFFKNDVEVLKKIKELHERSEKLLKTQKTKKEKSQLPTTQKDRQTISPSKLNDLKLISEAINTSSETIVNRMSAYLDEKLEGIDEIVVELIRSKVENERLKVKLDQFIKDNYSLKNEVENFKPLGLGLYLRKE
jgi:hypothetical protein